MKVMSEELIFENETSINRFSLMTKKEKPTEEQINLLKMAIPSATKCRQIIIDGLNSTPFQLVMLKYYNSLDSMYLKLMRADITIGDANEEKSKILASHKTNWAQANVELDDKIRALHNSEMEGKRQTAAAILPYLMQQQQNQQIQQQMIYQQQMQSMNANRTILVTPTTTNCTKYGNQINCTTN